MKVTDLKLSDSTLGMLQKRGYGVEKLLEYRGNLTKLKGIGPSREKEIDRALDEASRIGAASEAERLPEAPAAMEEAAVAAEGGGEDAPAPFEADEEAPEGGLVRYMDHSNNAMMARVAKNLGDGRLNLQAFTGAGGAHRVEDVPRAGEWGEPGRWAPVEAV